MALLVPSPTTGETTLVGPTSPLTAGEMA
jgi:hypothetical protein